MIYYVYFQYFMNYYINVLLNTKLILVLKFHLIIGLIFTFVTTI